MPCAARGAKTSGGHLHSTPTAALRGGCDHCQETEVGRGWRSNLPRVTQLRVGQPLAPGTQGGSAKGRGARLEWRKERLEVEGRLSCAGGWVHGLQNRERCRREGSAPYRQELVTVQTQTGPRGSPAEEEQTWGFLKNPSKGSEMLSSQALGDGVQWNSDPCLLPSRSGPGKGVSAGLGSAWPSQWLGGLGGRERAPRDGRSRLKTQYHLPVIPASQLHASGPDRRGDTFPGGGCPLSPPPHPLSLSHYCVLIVR